MELVQEHFLPETLCCFCRISMSFPRSQRAPELQLAHRQLAPSVVVLNHCLRSIGSAVRTEIQLTRIVLLLRASLFFHLFKKFDRPLPFSPSGSLPNPARALPVSLDNPLPGRRRRRHSQRAGGTHPGRASGCGFSIRSSLPSGQCGTCSLWAGTMLSCCRPSLPSKNNDTGTARRHYKTRKSSGSPDILRRSFLVRAAQASNQTYPAATAFWLSTPILPYNIFY